MPAGFLTPRRLLIGVLCLISLLGSVGLAWWQWDRFESASGTFQNLGYVLQWPLFGLFPLFLAWRIRRLRREAAAEDAAKDAGENPGSSAEPVATVPAPRPVRPVPAVPEEEDDELAAYNRYLAELNARAQQES
ncbi:hypothetical protein FNH05_19510 [Amycolatopsis rhizosphaerae]|uniref:Uncharacterized protein n=1 Tax=Amycolatopsis rhizosphaerae TaxID=2053003 RepID=A0A558CE42_9PSEU|nr:hypothetical protein [Amycolatopsis rhizosphaerae]TVT47039.1 hypothetical protein FNH05_19510 [Amycolatopsis rhizosphaerae]